MNKFYGRVKDLVEKKSNGKAATTQKESNLYKRIGGLIETGGVLSRTSSSDREVASNKRTGKLTLKNPPSTTYGVGHDGGAGNKPAETAEERAARIAREDKLRLASERPRRRKKSNE